MKTEPGVTNSWIKSGNEKDEKKERSREYIVQKLVELGVPNPPEEIIKRLLVIEENSGFNHDSEMVCEAFENVLSVYESRYSESTHMTPQQKKDGLLAAFLHDIGKSGDTMISHEGKLAVIKLFSVNVEIKNTDKIGDVISKYFSQEKDEMFERLWESGIREDMTMRWFWNRHAWWTHDILAKYPECFSDRVRLIASSHHIHEGENPCGVKEEEVPYEAEVIGALEHYVDFFEERLLMIIDKYQAALTRNEKSTHQRAMEYLKVVFPEDKRDSTTGFIIDIVDELGQKDALFPKTKNKTE